MTNYQKALWLVLALSAAASCISPPFPDELLLQHIPTVLVLAALPLLVQRYPVSNFALTCLVGFMLLHVLGARFIYSYVPYDQLFERFLGFNLTARYGFRRNHYDRFVHFAFGFLWVRPVWEVITRHFRVPPRFGVYATVEFVLAFSLVYELVEWGLTLVLAPEDAGAYNGEQGDIWDAHRDMSCALLGALLALLLWHLGRKRTRVVSAEA